MEHTVCNIFNVIENYETEAMIGAVSSETVFISCNSVRKECFLQKVTNSFIPSLFVKYFKPEVVSVFLRVHRIISLFEIVKWIVRL